MFTWPFWFRLLLCVQLTVFLYMVVHITCPDLTYTQRKLVATVLGLAAAGVVAGADVLLTRRARRRHRRPD